MEQLLKDIKKLTDIIVGSKPDTTIAGEIESMALEIGHHPLVLNAHNPNAFANVIGSWVSVKDRLPKKADYYLVTMNSKTYRMYFSTCATPTWYDDVNDIKEVEAWMPMPKPIDA